MWLQDQRYVLLKKVKLELERRMAALDKDIEENRERYRFLHDLLLRCTTSVSDLTVSLHVP